MKNSNRLMLLGGVVGVILTAVSPVVAQSPRGMWQTMDANQDGNIDRAEFDAMRTARFTEMDGNGDAIVSAEEMMAMHEKRRAEMAAKHDGMKDGEGHGARMFERMDTTGDGRVTADEWQASSLKRFVRLDSNGDGAVTAEEMAAFHGGKGGHMGKGRHGGKADLNDDGQITSAEWQQAGDAMFARLDENGDGKIAGDELPQHQRKHGDDAPAQP